MVVVDVAVAAGPDEVTHLQVALLGQHVGQQCVAGDVEGNAQEDVRAALVQLATELAVGHIELEEGVAGHERHLRQRSEEHTSELQSPCNLVCRLLLEKKKQHAHTCVSSTTTSTSRWSRLSSD